MARNNATGQECKKCGEWKPLKEFPKETKFRNGKSRRRWHKHTCFTCIELSKQEEEHLYG